MELVTSPLTTNFITVQPDEDTYSILGRMIDNKVVLDHKVRGSGKTTQKLEES